MEKSIHTPEYRTLLRLLREARERAGVTQVELAERLEQTQSFVSKVEQGDRRLDLVQLRTILAELGVSLPDFVARFEDGVRRLR
jgi:transcriptional regulator with XRE-family HTH domain